jgi:proteasome accessory factor A
MFERLVGVETEYTVRFHPNTPRGRRVPNHALFQKMLWHVRSKVAAVPAFVREYGWFLANGGAVRFERIPFFAMLPSSGFVEGATPECRGPRQLVLHQRAQDVLLSRAAATSGQALGAVTLLKSNRDSLGHSCASHENYEATIATGATLLVWRLGLVFLMPFLVMGCIVGLALATFPWLLALPLLVLCRFFGGRNLLTTALVTGLSWLFSLALLPVVLVAEIFVRLTAFRVQRRRMRAFLVSRPIIAGSGTVGPWGRFSLSPRALVIRSSCGMAAECFRPIFYFGQVVKGTMGVLLHDWAGYGRLFHRRQRLHIGVGDSNMAHTAEYLKIGTTLLVLDAIEGGALADAPRLRAPVRALKKLSADPTLKATVRLSGGRRWTALAIQRYYLEGCRRFVEQSTEESAEARLVLRLWEKTLEALEKDPRRLVGKLDWVTKRYLLQAVGQGMGTAAKRKLDLRYHELSPGGYYLQMEAAGIAPTVVEPEEVLEATIAPPTGTPAEMRGRLIREFAYSHPMRAGWSTVAIGAGLRARTIHLGVESAADKELHPTTRD